MEHFLLPWAKCFSTCAHVAILLWEASTLTLPSCILVWNMTLSPVPGNWTLPGPVFVPRQGEQTGVQALAPGGAPVSPPLERIYSCRALPPRCHQTGTATGWVVPLLPGWLPLSRQCSWSPLAVQWVFILFTDLTGCFGSAVNLFEYTKKAALIIQ